jgi:ribonuclease P protein component
MTESQDRLAPGSSSDTAKRMGFPFTKAQRLRTSSEFQTVFEQRLSVADDVLVVYGKQRKGSVGRLGLSVSRKVGNAVRRNRWKRCIREVFRQHPELMDGWDLVVIPRRGVTPDYAMIARSLPSLVQRIGRKLSKRAGGQAR